MNLLTSISNPIKYNIANAVVLLPPTDYRYYLPFENNFNALTNGTSYSAVNQNSGTVSFSTTKAKGTYSASFSGAPYLTLDGSIYAGLNSGAISCWIYLNNSNRTTICGLQVDGNNSYGFLTIGQYNNSGAKQDGIANKVYFRCNNQGQLYTSGTTLNTGQWYHIVVNWNNSSNVGNMYINGSLDFSCPSLNTSDFLNWPGYQTGMYIGIWKGNATTYGNAFNGLIDDFRIYNRNLSATEIASLYGY